MKMTRSKLKGIVKECLVEILSEGINTSNNVESSTFSQEISEKKKRDAIEAENHRLSEHRKKLDKRMSESISNLTNDSVMRDILADTARTTLREQMQHDRQPGRPDVGGAGIDLNNIFTGASQNWSELAFSEKK